MVHFDNIFECGLLLRNVAAAQVYIIVRAPACYIIFFVTPGGNNDIYYPVQV